MDLNTKVEYLSLALRMQNVEINKQILELMIEDYEAIKSLKGKFTVRDAIIIQGRVNSRFVPPNSIKSELEDGNTDH